MDHQRNDGKSEEQTGNEQPVKDGGAHRLRGGFASEFHCRFSFSLRSIPLSVLRAPKKKNSMGSVITAQIPA